jgi:hypothetical protein
MTVRRYIVLKWILEIGLNGMDSTDLVKDSTNEGVL